jgi:hypothetical protein
MRSVLKCYINCGTEHHMEVTSAQTVDDTLVYLLVDESHKKTAQIGCRLLPQP